MAEYIKREDVLKFPIRKDHYDKENGNEHFICGIECVIEFVENIPAADVAEVKHGKWIDREGPDEDLNVTDRCSVCWHSETHSPTVEVPYCWFCGAKMDLED